MTQNSKSLSANSMAQEVMGQNPLSTPFKTPGKTPPKKSVKSHYATKPQVLPYSLSENLLNETCPACSYHIATPFYDGGKHPLTTLAWPKSKIEANTMEKLPLDFIRCVDCGHVYNRVFDYANVPYSDKPNLMFNSGQLWQTHMAMTRESILAHLPQNPTVIEIGCGDGHFLKALADARPEGRYIGFDPNGYIAHEGHNIEFFADWFDAKTHIETLQPDLIISRHVLEHLMNPLGFVQELSFAAAWSGLSPLLFIEVPCIDNVFESGRTVDFFYEHNSHFTTQSLQRLLSRCASDIISLSHGYDEEVLYALTRLGNQPAQLQVAKTALEFLNQAKTADNQVKQQINQLAKQGCPVAIWGGTGKAATFINRYGLDAERFPLVVDSDSNKVGTYVPGMGQLIQSPEALKAEALKTNSPALILITTQWRAKDIAQEISRRGIPHRDIWIEHQGQLMSINDPKNPYRF